MSNKEKPWKQQEDLAESVIRGELERLEDIVEVPPPSFSFFSPSQKVVLALYGEKGWHILLGYKYAYNPLTHIIRCEH